MTIPTRIGLGVSAALSRSASRSRRPHSPRTNKMGKEDAMKKDSMSNDTMKKDCM